MDKKPSIKDLETWFRTASLEEKKLRRDILREDDRQGAQKIVKRIEKNISDWNQEVQRLDRLWNYEKKVKERGFSCIAGIDEAGRGPLMGPVVAATVVLSPETQLIGLDDSKKLNEATRERLYDEIYEKALFVGVGMSNHEEIDEINILQATKKAMTMAIENSKAPIDFLLIDAVSLTDISIEQLPLIKGDQKSASIAAASIVAKVTRDRWVGDMAKKYPGYGFEKNKGYGTKFHREALKEKGPCPVHRRTFIKNLV